MILQPIDNPYVALILWTLLAYGLVVGVWLILENRSPQSTFAWLFLLLIFPIVGVLVYVFFGRGRHAFSREDKLMQQVLTAERGLDFVLFSAQQRERIERVAQEEPVAYRRKLLNLVQNNATSAITDRNRLELLQDAAQKYPRLLADVEAARHSIHMAYYIWEDDEFTNKLKDLLIGKAKEGVEVRILVDAQGLSVSRKYLREMRAGNVQMFTYYNYQSPFKIHTVSYRNHRKIVVIDGAIGYMGGLNISQDHLDGGKHFDSWRDTHLRIEGEAARMLQGVFLTSWYNTTQEQLPVADYFPPLDPLFKGYLPIQITTSGPDSQWQAIRQIYFQMITAAEKHLYIQSPFFIPDESIMEALKAAALAGVDVRIMCAPRGTTYTIPYWAAHTYFADLVSAGVRVFLYQKGYFHPKTVNVDSVICSVGTANMDIRSFSINYEINAIIYDAKTAQKLAQDFLHDLGYCTEFTLADYEASNVLVRLRDSLCRLASPLL